MNKKPINLQNPAILLIQLGDIGDVVLTMPAIKAIKENYPGCRLVVAVREKAFELLEDSHLIHDVIKIEKKQGSTKDKILYYIDFIKNLRKFKFDIAIDLREGDRGAFLSVLSGAKIRAGFFSEDNKIRNFAFNRLIKWRYTPDQYVGDYYLALVEKNFKIGAMGKRPEIFVPETKKIVAQKLFKELGIGKKSGVMAIQPFSLWPYKEWGDEKYAALIKKLTGDFDIDIIITGIFAEKDRAEKIAQKAGNRAFNLAGKTSLGVLPAVLKSCFLFMGGDSAGIHIASAVGTPTISIFGPSAASSWAPQGKKHIVITKDFDCIPCREKGCNGSLKSRCLEELGVDEVVDIVAGRIEEYVK